MDNLIEALKAYVETLGLDGRGDPASARGKWRAEMTRADDMALSGALIYLAAEVKSYKRQLAQAHEDHLNTLIGAV